MLLFLLSLILQFQKLAKNKAPEVVNTFWMFQTFFKTPHRAQLFSTSALSTIFHCTTTLIFAPTDTQILVIKKLNINETKQTSQEEYVDFSSRTCFHMPKEEKERTDGFLALSSYCFHTYTTSYFGLIFLSKLTVINNRERQTEDCISVYN